MKKWEVNINQNITLSFLLLPERTDLMLLTVCRSKRSRAFVTLTVQYVNMPDDFD